MFKEFRVQSFEFKVSSFGSLPFTVHFPTFEPHRRIGHIVFLKLYYCVYCGFYFQLSPIFHLSKISRKVAKPQRQFVNFFSLFTVYCLLFTVCSAFPYSPIHPFTQ